MPESIQHKLDRVRSPRVHITYDVETLGSIVKTELPFVVGIMADLSGNAIDATKDIKTPYKDRKYIEIDRDNLDAIMEKLEPSVTLKTAGYSGELKFKKLEDFNPINVLRNVPALSEDFEKRTRLSNLVAKLDGNLKLQQEFVDAFNDLPADANATAALQKYLETMNPSADTPSVTDSETDAGTQTTSGLVFAPHAADGGKTKFYKITAVTGGSLFTKDGKSPVAADSFISADDGAAGLKFTPAAGSTEGSFTVQASSDGKALIGDPVVATITVKATPTPKASQVVVESPENSSKAQDKKGKEDKKS